MADEDDPVDALPEPDAERPAESPERILAVQQRLRDETKRYRVQTAKRQMR